MAPVSDPSPTVGESSAMALPSDPPSSATSKRRWSPCTWRYAIEEVQPELGSRPRSSSSNNNNNSSSNNNNAYSAAASMVASSRGSSEHAKARLYHHQQAERERENEENRRSFHGSEGYDGKADDRPKHRRRPQHQQRLSPPVSVVAKESPKDEGEDQETLEDEHKKEERSEFHADSSHKKRKKREMSPSELYFCEICASKAASVKANVKASPSHLQDQ